MIAFKIRSSKSLDRENSPGLRSESSPHFLVSSEHGGALVEIAVAMPILMVMLTGIFSFSIALYQKLQLSEAVSNGGRYLATARGQTDPCSLTTSAIYAAASGPLPG